MTRTGENLETSLAEEFSPEKLDRADEIIQNYKNKPGALIPVLEEVQECLGHLPRSILEKVALGLRLSFSEVYGVATFYSFFTMVPRGRHTIRCCLGTACYVRGSKHNLQRLSSDLKIDPGTTTPDRRFSLETVRCLGACGLAPVVMIDEDTHRQVKPSKINEILKNYD